MNRYINMNRYNMQSIKLFFYRSMDFGVKIADLSVQDEEWMIVDVRPRTKDDIMKNWEILRKNAFWNQVLKVEIIENTCDSKSNRRRT